MGEIDTKPIESVQAALTFFEQSNEQRKSSPSNDQQEVEKQGVERELACVKVQLEAKESAYKQALLKVDHYQKTADELSTLLKNSDLKKNFYIHESREATSRVTELESALEPMARRLSEADKAQEQLGHATRELQSTQARVLSLEAELAILREAKHESTSQMQAMERLLSEERLQKEELSRQVSEMNEAITRLKMEAVQAEGAYASALAAKETELEAAAKAISSAQEKQECMNDLENQLAEKSSYIDSLQLEIKRANEMVISSERAASEAVSELNKVSEDLQLQETKCLDQAVYISVLEAELEQSRSEVAAANDTKTELEKSKEQENEAQVEIALLKFELHKGRSRQAAAEAAETRAQSEKTALYNALQQMGLEAEETKKENRMLKEALLKLDDDQSVKHTHEAYEAEVENEEDATEIKKQEEEKQVHHDPMHEIDDMKRELEMAMSKIGELRTRAEQATSRAEAAEKAKSALEEQNKKRREHKERRKAALAALREESISREFESIKHDVSAAKNYQPLGKVLNMKF